MNEDEIYEVLQSFKSALDYLADKIEQMDNMYHDNNSQIDERLETLEDAIFEQILEPTKKAIEEKAFNEYHDKYGERLDAYNDKLRLLEGDDELDLTKEAYEGWKGYEAPEGYEPYTEEEYVDALVESVEEQLKEIREKLNLSEDAKVEAVSLPDGTTTISVDDEPIVEKEETVEEEKEPVEEVDDMAALEEELKRYKRK